MTGGLAKFAPPQPPPTKLFTPPLTPESGEEDGVWPYKKGAFQPYHAQSVPKSQNLGVHASSDGYRPVTTMMLRNIPNKYTQATLLQEIDEIGFAGTYDFFYLPMDVHNRSNVGYAFVNFITPQDAEHFRRLFAEYRFQRYQSRKIGGVCVAHVQGLDANLRHFENRAVTHAKNGQYRPIVFQGNCRVDFEEAVAGAKLRAALQQNETMGFETTADVHAHARAAIVPEAPMMENYLKAAGPLPTAVSRYGLPMPQQSTKDIDALLSLRSMLAERLSETRDQGIARQTAMQIRQQHAQGNTAAAAMQTAPSYSPPRNAAVAPPPGLMKQMEAASQASWATPAAPAPAYITVGSLFSTPYGKGKFNGQEATEFHDGGDSSTPRTNKLILGSALEQVVPDGPWWCP
jgi:hypothetical protein